MCVDSLIEYSQFEDLGLKFDVSEILLQQETKMGRKNLLCQSAEK